MKLIINILLFYPFLLFSQVATFEADTSIFYIDKELNPAFYSEMMKSEWKIKGQLLKYGSKPIEVEIDNKIDTIYFRKNIGLDWDTLLCNISKPNRYTFIYNECCGGFYVNNINEHQIVKFKLSKSIETDSCTLLIDDISSDIKSELNQISFTTLILSKDSPMDDRIYEIKVLENQKMRLKFRYLPINNDTNELIINLKNNNLQLN